MEYFGNHPMLKMYFESLPPISAQHPVVTNFAQPDATDHFLADPFAATWLRAAQKRIDVFRMICDLEEIIEDELPGVIEDFVDARRNN
jgi:hypothetical protein